MVLVSWSRSHTKPQEVHLVLMPRPLAKPVQDSPPQPLSQRHLPGLDADPMLLGHGGLLTMWAGSVGFHDTHCASENSGQFVAERLR
jgi:hypothetical protein